MTKERAEGIQRTILNDISDVIPARLVGPLWETYQIEVGRIKEQPCTCTPKYWMQVVEELRKAVYDALVYWKAQEEAAELENQKAIEAAKRGRKPSKQ